MKMRSPLPMKEFQIVDEYSNVPEIQQDSIALNRSQ